MFAGGARGTDETGTNKDTHQLPVISMGTLIDVPAPIFFMSILSAMGRALTREPPCRCLVFTLPYLMTFLVFILSYLMSILVTMPFGRTSIIRRVLRRLICVPSTVICTFTGLSS